MLNDFSPIRLRFLFGWVVVIILSGCFRSVPVEPGPEATDPVVISEMIEAESFYFNALIEKWIVTAVISDEQSNGIKAIFTTEGRFTQSGQTELLSLVDGIPGGQGEEAYWVVLQETNQIWQVVGVSEPVSADFRSERSENTTSYWMPPQILDFNHDGIQEVFIPFHEEQGGWEWDSVHVYRFDGENWGELDWSMIISQDNTRVPVSDLALPYRYGYQVKWTLEDRDNDQVDEILMNETVVYYGLNEKTQTFDMQNVLGRRDQERVFKWVENIFEPDSNELSFNDLGFTGSGTLFPWWNSEEFPEMVFAEFLDGGLPSIHFTVHGENERIVSVTEWRESASFQLLGDRVYYPGGVMDIEGIKAIPVPGLPGTLHVLASPDETQLAWLFVSELGGLNNLAKGVNATLLVSNVAGDAPKVIWTMEQKDVSTWYSLLDWSGDSRHIYLGQTADLEAFPWRNFSGLLAVDSKSGAVTRIGEQVNRVEIALSPDEAWLAQVEQLGQADDFSLNLNFESRATNLVWEIDSLENAVRVGNFSFSPSEEEVVWQEWIKTDSDDYMVVRGLDLEDGLSRIIYKSSQVSKSIGIIRDWVDDERFILVEEAGQGGSYLIFAENGQKVPLSPYAFLGVRK